MLADLVYIRSRLRHATTLQVGGGMILCNSFFLAQDEGGQFS